MSDLYKAAHALLGAMRVRHRGGPIDFKKEGYITSSLGGFLNDLERAVDKIACEYCYTQAEPGMIEAENNGPSGTCPVCKGTGVKGESR